MNEERIGRYLVTGVIGAGGFATVLRAEDERLEDEVALKVLAENHSLDPDVRERFLSEGRVLRRIDSPHVVRVLDLGETDRQQPYLVLELADRGDLASRVDRLRRDGWGPDGDDVLAVAGPLTAALEAVHRAGVVHRDLSPANVLLRSTLAPDPGAGSSPLVAADERLVLADLGLSKDLARSSGLTLAGGTEGFRPPEQRGGPTTVDTRADLWSLSALVVWLVTGSAPTDQEQAEQLLRGAALPAAAVGVLVQGLSDLPRKRQSDVTAWADQLEAALRPPPAPILAAPPGGEDGSRRPRPTRALLAAAGLGLVLGAGGAAYVGRDAGPSVTVIDGSVEITDRDGDLALTLRGPESVVAGETATFSVATSGVDDHAWFTPEGTVIPGSPALTVATSSPGSAAVTVVGTARGGAEVRVTHQLRVEEGADG